MPTAIVTGASRGFGRAVAFALAERGWALVLDARGEAALRAVAATLPADRTMAIAGDIGDAGHRAELVRAAERLGGLDLLLNNASELGPSPLPALRDLSFPTLERILRVNAVAPLALTQLVLPRMPSGGTILNVSSDAAVEGYEGWGGYGASKAALDQLTRVLAAEHPELRVYAVDPGDMRTRMHQDAFPGEDISDRPEPATVVPHLLALLDGRLPSGRYRAADVPVGVDA